MKKLILSIGIGSCLFLNVVFAKSVTNIHHWSTHNGICVLFVQAKQIPMLDVAAVFKAGSVYDGKEKGLANLTNAMLNEGAAQYDVNQLAEQFDNVGAKFSNSVGKEMSIVSLRSLTKPKILQAALKTFSLVLTKPNFPEMSVRRLKKQILISLQQAQQQPSYIANRVFSEAIWNKHSYANPVAGTSVSVPQLSRVAVQQFYQHYYVEKNAMLMMVGDVSMEKAHQIAEQLLSKLPSGQAAASIPVVKSNKSLVKHIAFPAAQNTILIGEVGVKHNSRDRFSLLVGNYILGGDGMSSILMRNIREKYGLTYGVYSQFSSFTQRGEFVISLQSRNDQAVRASQLTQDYLKKFLAAGPTASQLQAAKNFLIGSFPLGVSSNSAVLQNLVYIGYYHLPLNFLDTYRQNIQRVTALQIKQAFNQTIQLNRLVVISAGGK